MVPNLNPQFGVDALEEHLASRGAKSIDVEWFVFGSILGPNQIRSDTDILIVYPSLEALKAAKRVADRVPDGFQLSLTCMSRAEADETQFVLTERCVQILGDGASRSGAHAS